MNAIRTRFQPRDSPFLQLPLDYWQTILDLSTMNNLLGLPDEIGYMKRLEVLHLCSCEKIVMLPQTIGELTNLVHLDLSFMMKLQYLPQDIGKLTNLRILNLSHCCGITILPPQIGQLTKLQKLELYDMTNLSGLPYEIGNLSSLKRLNLGFTGILTLPRSIGRLKQLETLYVHEMKNFFWIASEIGELQNLKVLNLNDCKILKSVPDSIGGLKKLEELYLQGCSELFELPETIGGLDSLRSLKLSCNNSIEKLPRTIGSLRNLETLDLGDMYSLHNLPNEIFDLPNLRVLNLEDSATSIPVSQFGHMDQLEVLGLHATAVQNNRVPEEIYNMSNLRELRLPSGQHLPQNVLRLKFLRKLFLQDVDSVSPEIRHLENLESLTISSKRLARLPVEIGELENLRVLDVEYCMNLESLFPVTIGQCPKLEILALNVSKFLESPQDLSMFQNLGTLILSWDKENITSTIIDWKGRLKWFMATSIERCPKLGFIEVSSGLSWNREEYISIESSLALNRARPRSQQVRANWWPQLISNPTPLYKSGFIHFRCDGDFRYIDKARLDREVIFRALKEGKDETNSLMSILVTRQGRVPREQVPRGQEPRGRKRRGQKRRRQEPNSLERPTKRRRYL